MDTDIEERLIQLEEAIDQLKHSNKIILNAITEMRIKDTIDYIKSKQDVYTVMFVPNGMKDHDVITYLDKQFTSSRLAKDRIEYLEKTSLRKNEGRYISVLGSLDTRSET
jgi:folylpolyglutamate synthase/dihydropteroate synthase